VPLLNMETGIRDKWHCISVLNDDWHCVFVLHDIFHIDRMRIFSTRNADVGFDYLIGPEQWDIQAE